MERGRALRLMVMRREVVRWRHGAGHVFTGFAAAALWLAVMKRLGAGFVGRNTVVVIIVIALPFAGCIETKASSLRKADPAECFWSCAAAHCL
jgi:uncharacterized membrane protein